MPGRAVKITGIAVHVAPLTSHAAYYMAGGKTCDTVETVVVRLETDAALPFDHLRRSGGNPVAEFG